ncbi:MAG: hypothetical protein ACYC6L_02890, partial [Anaerolineae bacterium]
MSELKYIHVTAGDTALQDTLLTSQFPVSAEKTVHLEEWDGEGRLLQRLPAQYLEGAWYWVLAGVTRPGQTRRFKLTESAPAPAVRERGVRFRTWHTDPKEDRALDIEIDGQPLATYNYCSSHSGI